ncbi:hypothetical protein, partial [Thermococcus sp. MV5]
RSPFYMNAHSIRKSPDYFLVFSPRAMHPFYNHHFLVEIISRSKFKKQIILLFINHSKIKDKYLKDIISRTKQEGIKVSLINRLLSADEMARLFLISDFNVNIPFDDQFGMSIMEGALLCSVPVLNKHIRSYRELMGQKNAIFIDPYSIKKASRTIDNAIVNK